METITPSGLVCECCENAMVIGLYALSCALLIYFLICGYNLNVGHEFCLAVFVSNK